MQLTEHFSLEEMTASATAAEKHIDNTPSPEIINNLTTTAQGLELVRAFLGNVPMRITSGYRCPDLNKAVGGVPDSAHLSGFAADFEAPQYGSPLHIVASLAKSGIKYDQCIMEKIWVHVSFDPKMRGEVLTANFHDGHDTTYTQGV